MDKKIEKKKGLKMKHIFWIVGGLVIAFLLYSVIFSDHSSVFRAEKEKLTISTVEASLFNDYITLIGQVEPISTIYLDVEEGGKVEEIYIEEGEMVKEGDVILKLKNNDLSTQIMNSESSMAYQANELRNTQIKMEQQQISNRRSKMEVDLLVTQAERKYKQYKVLFQEDLVAKEEYLRTKEDYELSLKQKDLTYQQFAQDSIFRSNQKQSMDESLKNMRQNLIMAKRRLENLNVKAPDNGQLGSLDAEIGESISRGQRLGMLHILTDYKIKALPDEHYIDRVRRDLNASFDRNGVDYTLKVKKVYPEVREGQFEIDMVFTGPKPENIRTGQTYHTKLELGQSAEAILISKGGFFQSTGGQWVYVLNENETEATKRSIRIGKQNPQYYEVLEGLNAGEKVIISSYDLFGDNDKIVFK
ncbi:MAG: biotin/lipoyl-binding protein [Prolixibacteraceae bacterium]|nr:biotin/lipoyl-binding protein [Prolixibacteraceae bacterium]MBT6004564.1 biotin/lipoyl-binding protein [Prolixibacteraceae bacterium]MBT6766959.1 biotin/lipoyl-binding protein [Prolixibacteraceae bacterium]MBT6997973.1 biotin/lipoyl-binding protein [Prolixibacteraceae bacterium]MBT7396017.1 biotin/lipoyl-binding protein [Prolixibacteraceae bacterium]